MRIILLAALGLACGSTFASGLQVAPVSLTLAPADKASGLWLTNTGDNVIHAQVRPYHWIQRDAADQLEPSNGLIVSPPMVEIQPGQKQLIRVIRIGAPPAGTNASEDTWRLAIDELPIDVQGKKGVQFVLHYSVPVFVQPAASAAPAAQLRWDLLRDGDKAVLQVANSGTGHAQLAALTFVDHAGKRVEISGGLLGYVLPGVTMRWALKPPARDFAGGGSIEATVNGMQAKQDVALADPVR
ncbi:MAG: molecular chaperone [Rudaea sp.]|uniref:fimbrial biogenesis chaperone n=1 Tax=Rudaea sp. TaxID=2136325 RepID=UPI0039E712E3